MFPRLYAILDVEACRARALDPARVADVWLDAGVRLLQLRAKDLPSGAFLELATALATRARAVGATFIVNDRADIARLSGADGVHVGQDDFTPRQVRLLLPEPAVVGLSTHIDDQVRAALDQPASYIAVGPVFATSSKAQPDPVIGLGGVRRARALVGDRPLVAIGGITLERMQEVLDAGASTVAVISDLMGEGRVERYLSGSRG